MRPTKRFVDRFIESNKVTLPMIQYDDRRELIVLRNELKEDVEYEDSDFTLTARERLELINEVLVDMFLIWILAFFAQNVDTTAIGSLPGRYGVDRVPDGASIREPILIGGSLPLPRPSAGL